jgi:ATP-dependent Clp protease ATP-binding subunit ClpA
MGLARRFLGSPWAADLVWKKIEQSGKIGKPIEGPHDLPLSIVCKRSLSYAAEETDKVSSKHIGTEHLLLGLLREENCFAAQFLNEHNVRLEHTRDELIRTPHQYAASENFVPERAPLPEEIELKSRIKSIFRNVQEAVAECDFEKAREYSREESVARAKLRSLYQQYGLLDWLYV